MHEFHGNYGSGQDADSVSGTSAGSFPGTEPIDATAPPADAIPERAPNGPSWSERRAAKRAAKGETSTEGTSGGGIPWDVRVKLAVVLSFVILVSVLVFNKMKGKAKVGNSSPLASIAGSKGTDASDPAPAKPDAPKDEEPILPPPSSPSPPEPAKAEPPTKEPEKALEAAPPVASPPADEKQELADTSAGPPSPALDPKPDAHDAAPPSELPPPKDATETPGPMPTKGTEALPPPADELPAKAPAVEPSPPIVDGPPPAEKVEAKAVEPQIGKPEARGQAALPDLTTPPPTREAQPPAAAPAGDLAEGEGFAIPNAGMARTHSAARSGAGPEVDPTAARAAVPAPTPRAGGSTDDTIHVVRKGENFWTISRYHYASGRFYKALWDANRDVAKVPEDLYVGASIRIPAVEDLNREMIEAPKMARAGGDATPKNPGPRDLRAERASAMPDTAVVLPRANPAKRPLITKPPSTEPAYKLYVVKGRNETLRSVARDQLKDSERDDELYRLNRDDFEGDSRRLRPGMALKIPNDTRTR